MTWIDDGAVLDHPLLPGTSSQWLAVMGVANALPGELIDEQAEDWRLAAELVDAGRAWLASNRTLADDFDHDRALGRRLTR